MRNIPPSLLTMLSLLLPCSAFSLPNENKEETTTDQQQAAPADKPKAKEASSKKTALSKFEPFTGKITKNKVRMRLQPGYDGQVLREFTRNDLVIVLGETDDFYAIQPPADMRAYVFRTYVLDNVVEGSRVNVRLKPDLDAPVVAQLNSGDRVEGTVNPSNNKWMEIKLPEATRFYIAKEYIEKAGDAGMMARQEKRREEVYHLLNTTEAMSKNEMQKPFDQINIDAVKANYQHIILDYTDFPEAGEKAKDSLAALQDAYTAKKVAYLEAQAKNSSIVLEAKTKQLNDELQAHKNKLATLEQRLEKERQIAATAIAVPAPAAMAAAAPVRKPTQLPINMSIWLPIEENLFANWTQQTHNSNPNAFYEEQRQNSFVLRGIIDPYNRPVKNKPGDYMLINSASKLPIAFLYSTQVNLQDFIGHEVTIRVAPRSNNNYAFPAYFVLSIE
ncbi:SH3 domain-containing protein [Candidatus Protochlamydia phocaeensis]|uniref:SH3 domain-containing protein n=1 Tax=Candidatus Protochlamydia phocaeensis TaxID=1414722 RepID=UPI0008399593|nr:hypothetical protein [Candidatus Protochlamydia phocaeensis]